MATTKLDKDQKKELLALGATLAEIKSLQEEGYDFPEIKDICQQAADKRDADKQSDADRQAKATDRAQKKESYKGAFEFPDKSTFNPVGEDKRPRPDLPYKMFWCGVPLEKSTLSYDEIERLMKLRPGVYTCTKGDGTPFEIRVEADQDTARGTIDKLKVNFRCRGADKHNHLGMLVYLDQMLAQQSGPVLHVA